MAKQISHSEQVTQHIKGLPETIQPAVEYLDTLEHVDPLKQNEFHV